MTDESADLSFELSMHFHHVLVRYSLLIAPLFHNVVESQDQLEYTLDHSPDLRLASTKKQCVDHAIENRLMEPFKAQQAPRCRDGAFVIALFDCGFNLREQTLKA